MTLIQGKATDVSYSVIDYTTTRIGFELNDPNVSNAGTLIFDRIKWVTTDAGGNFNVELAPTTGMRGDAYYSIRGQYFSVDGEWVDLDVFPYRFFVRNTGDVLNIADLLERPTPEGDVWVWVGESNDPTYRFWYQPSTANLFQNV